MFTKSLTLCKVVLRTIKKTFLDLCLILSYGCALRTESRIATADEYKQTDAIVSDSLLLLCSYK